MTDTSYLYEYFMEKSTDQSKNKKPKNNAKEVRISNSKKNMKEDKKHERVLPA